jgi:hypothetical protein
MFVVGKIGEVKFAVVSCVVVAKNKLIIGAHELVGIHVALNGEFYGDEFTNVEGGAIFKFDFTPDEAFGSISFFGGESEGLEGRAGLNGFKNLLKVGFNLQF